MQRKNTKPERSRGKRRDTQTETKKIKQKQKETGTERREENCICSWSFQLQGCLHLTSFTFYHRFLLFFSSFLLPEREILSTPDLSYFSSPDVQYRQIRRQGMMASSSVLRGTERRRHRKIRDVQKSDRIGCQVDVLMYIHTYIRNRLIILFYPGHFNY